MQQLDDSELWKVPQEPPPEEPMRDVDEGTPSPDSPEKVDGPAELSPEGRSEAKSVLESAPALPQRPTSVNAEENLPNGELQDPFSNECSPEEAQAKAIPVAAEEGDRRPPQGGPEAVPTADPAGQSPDPGKAPASRQRKLAMEEIVIRDHLGQEVGCMDAVGQNQSSLEKEESLEDHTDVGVRCDRGSQPGPVDGVLDANEAPGEGPCDHELSRRDSPEGESPTDRDPQDESGYPKGQGDGLPEKDSLAREAGGRGEGCQKAVPEQSPEEVVPTLALAPGDAPATGSVGQSQGSQVKTPEGPESGVTEEQPGPNRPGSPLEQLTVSPPHPFPPVPEMKDPSSREEAEVPLLDPFLPSSPTRLLAIPQDAVPSLQGTEESLPDQIPFQENGGSLLEPGPPSVPNHGPSPPSGQNPPLPGSEGSLLDQTPPAAQECLPDKNPPSPQGPLPSSLETKTSNSQGEVSLRPDVECSVKDQVTSSLQEAEGALSSWSQTLTGTQTASPLDQPAAPLPGGEPLALQHLPSSGHGTEGPATQQGQELPRHEVEASLPGTIPALTEQLPPLPGQEVSLPDAKTAASEESSAALLDPVAPPEPRVSPLPEADAFLPGLTPPSVDDPRESPPTLPDQIPPVLQNTEAAPLMGQTSASSPQEADDGAFTDATQAPSPSHASPGLPEEEGSCPDQGPPAPGDQTATSLLGQAPPFPEAAESLPEGQEASGPPAGSADSAEHASSPDRGQSPGLQDTPPRPSALPPLPDKSQAAEGEDAEGRGGASVASAGAGEATEVPGDLHAETQPLLKEAEGAGDLAAGDLPPKTEVLKPQAATGNHAPDDSGSRSSANTAYAHLPRQGQGQEPEKGKRKSCQCCILM